LLFALAGLLLLRFADRQFVAVLFQLPPRITRSEPVGRHPKSLEQPVPAQKSVHLGFCTAEILNGQNKEGRSSHFSDVVSGGDWSADILVRPCALVNTKADTKIHRRTRMPALRRDVR